MTRTERSMGCQRRALWPAGDDLPLFTLPGSRTTETAASAPATDSHEAPTTADRQITTDAAALARYQHQLYTAHARALLAAKE